MQENDKNGPIQDDEAKKRLQGDLRSNREEGREMEPSAEDQPEADRDPQAPRTGGTPAGMSARDVELRSEIAQHLGRHLYPTGREEVLDTLRAEHAPDRLVELAESLPADTRYANVQELVQALGLHTEAHRG
ncbi:DUF2795 domain-containing protein [Streptomyces reniochalinae]|uniref:DUF2795 domain-containing protein n=1 Tax=Streptomyces reniochalinae TaxID=2250578 RepID=A0A367F4C1_9ACTN|nr:DUF2795 domain-containing protein [Streptomyces reniochalinae]RCG25206.1 DUF2795 domain-containing protein [Streptomyces reniochalinae]